MVRVREFAGVALVAMLAMSAAVGIQRFESNSALQASVDNWIPGFAHPALAADAQSQTPMRVAQLIELGKPTPYVPIPSAQTPAPPPVVAAPPLVAPQTPQAPMPPPAQIDNAYLQANAVAERVRESVPSELAPYFDTVLYVSKAASGPWAQHMFVFHRRDSGRLALEDAFPVSTGRERMEKYFTSTPTGIFELDPNRFDRNHRSHRWHNAPMPWAMFLNYTIHNHLTGVALHSGIGHVALLGQRASGACVRMPPERAEYYFKRFQTTERGMVPVFAFDESRGTTRTDGAIARDLAGKPVLTEGYRVLLVIQNTSGGPAMVAVLS
jgi:lipoprotein-anchoring transpeptidase ErfK/SrfK